MTQDAASLDNLRDIAEPLPVSWWPLAAGWWIMVAAAAIALAVFGYRFWRRWESKAYRRAALTELASAHNDADVAEILKRTALCAYPRDAVASLTGETWCDWLSQTAGVAVPAVVGEQLARGVFHNAATRTTELTDYAKHWINSHRTQTEGSEEQRPT